MPGAFEEEDVMLLHLFDHKIHAKVVDLIGFKLLKDVHNAVKYEQQIVGRFDKHLVCINREIGIISDVIILIVGVEMSFAMDVGEFAGHAVFILISELAVNREPFDGVFSLFVIKTEIPDHFVPIVGIQRGFYES